MAVAMRVTLSLILTSLRLWSIGGRCSELINAEGFEAGLHFDWHIVKEFGSFETRKQVQGALSANPQDEGARTP